MTKVHRRLLNSLSETRAVNVNTPYGFQENVDQMTAKVQQYFDTSLQLPLRDLDLRSLEGASPEAQRAFSAAVANATYVFAGPGSPSYALAQWGPLPFRDNLAQVLAQGGVVCFSSAAALTLGAFTPPIYEIYKAGSAPTWLAGLNLTSLLGLNCVVLPHYNNAEGGTYDTSRCYLGERRLRLLEAELPDGVGIFGIDEHSAALIDLETREVSVLGKGEVHWRLAGTVEHFAAGTTFSLDDLGATAVALDDIEVDDAPEESALDAVNLLALRARDEALVAALDHARANARAKGLYDIADQIRDALTAFGVTVRDGASA
jgi:cyanophycinase-like exopeptidase